MSGFSPDHAGAEVRVSPNFGPRLAVSNPDMIILHYTGMATGPAAEGSVSVTASSFSGVVSVATSYIGNADHVERASRRPT